MVLARPPRRTLFLLLAPVVVLLMLSGALSATHAPDAFGHVATRVGQPDAADGDVASEIDSPIDRTFVWKHAGRTWRINVTADQAMLDGHAARDRLPFDHDYAAFVLDTSDDSWVTALAYELDGMFTAAGLQGRAKLDAMLSFVQQFPYALDKDTTPYSEWPRYPAETVFAASSDCEDTVILYVSLLRALGHDAVLLSPPRHMAAGVALSAPIDGAYVEHEGKRYYYAETTGEKWRLGKLPARFEGEPIRVIPVHSQAILSRPVWTAETHGETVEITITAHNVGDLVAHDVTLGARIQLGPRTWQRGSCTPVDVAGEASLTCVLRLQAPSLHDTARVHAWAESPDAERRTASGPYP